MKTPKNTGKVTGRVPLTQAVYKKIRQTLFLSDFPPGHKLDYRKMAESMHLSPTPVLQALKHMELMGLVKYEPNRGFFIIEITPREIKEVYAIRETLELQMVPAIIENLDDAGEQRLKTALDEYFQASQNRHVKLRMAKDFKFHLTMAEISGQALTVRILRYLLDFSYLRSNPKLIFYRSGDAAGREHLEIFQAVVARNASRVREALQRHIRNICRDTLAVMQQKEIGADEIDF